jgi:hypothetical protein
MFRDWVACMSFRQGKVVFIFILQRIGQVPLYHLGICGKPDFRVIDILSKCDLNFPSCT